MSHENIQKQFYQDVKQKKNAASGVHHKKGKRGFVGKLYTTADLLTGKAKKDYIKSGEVKTMNVYTTLMSYDELQTYSKEQQKNIVEKWRDNHTSKKIYDVLGLNQANYYKLLYKLGVLETPDSMMDKIYDISNRNNHKKTTAPGDLISWEKFKKLSKDEQYERLNSLLNKYDRSALRDAWGIKRGALDSKIHLLKKHMGKVVTKDQQSTKPKKNKEEKQTNKKSKNNEKGYSQQSFFDNEKDLEQEKSEQPSKPVKSNMTFMYEDTKEGFLTHMDLKQFISVLEKNPNTFKATVKIERMSE